MKLSNSKFFKKKSNVILTIVGGTLFLFGIIFLLYRLFAPAAPEIEEGQIRIERDGKVVTINENGLVQYESEEGVFYETWSPSKTAAFFSDMEAKARAYLENPPDIIPENGYKVTLWIDGKIVVIYIAEDDEVLDEVFETFDDTDDGDVSDFFEEDEDEEEDQGGDTQINPTPTQADSGSNPAPTSPPAEGNDGIGEQSAPDCDLYGTTVNQRTVISNTICQIEE